LKLHLSQELSLRFDSLYQWLNRKYQLELVTQKIAGYTFQIYKIANIAKALDDIIQNHHKADENAPYWTELWPSALALGTFIDSRNLEGKSVLGLGSGVGAAEMAARRKGADVVLSDYQEDALRIAELNWIINFNESPHIIMLDWRQPKIDRRFEVLLASDVAYEQRLFWPLVDTFHKLLAPSGEIYLSEPNRPIAKEFFDLLEKQGFRFKRFNQRIYNKARETDISVYRIMAKKEGE
jgi:predicted nicotinamide N-methyase